MVYNKNLDFETEMSRDKGEKQRHWRLYYYHTTILGRFNNHNNNNNNNNSNNNFCKKYKTHQLKCCDLKKKKKGVKK